LKNGTGILIFFVLFILSASPAFTQSFRALQVLNPKVEQGGVLMFKIAPQYMPPAKSAPSIFIQKLNQNYYPNKEGEVFIGISIDTKPGKYIAEYWSNGQRDSWDYEEVEVIGKIFPTRTRVPFVPNNKWGREREVLRNTFDTGYFYERFFKDKFIKPLDPIVIDQNRTIGDITARGSFGTGHEGVDLITLNPKTKRHQQPVKAINSGIVALVAKNYSTDGNMVIIDHGSGIFSIYMHLSGFRVKKVGDWVKKGEIIGISGDTGSAKRGGPHLHFAIKIRDIQRIQDVYVDPLRFIDIMNQYLDGLE